MKKRMMRTKKSIPMKTMRMRNTMTMMKNMMTKMTRMTKTMRIVTTGIWKMTAVR